MIVINIIGSGHLGQTIGHLLLKQGLVRINAVCNRTAQSALDAIAFMGDGIYYPNIADLPRAQITLITTPDDYILSACLALSENKNLQKGDTVVHFSGSHSSESLSSAKNKGCYVASIHPMCSFAQPALSVHTYAGTYCAMEGDAEALDLMRPLMERIGSITYAITKEKKLLYHAAGVFASNYLVTLSQQALECLLQAGVEFDIAKQVVLQLMKSTVSNLEQTASPALALTGPIQRGDLSTIEGHLKALPTDQQKNIYAVLGKSTVLLTALDEDKKQQLFTILNTEISPSKK